MAVGNWKMHKTASEAVSVAAEVAQGVKALQGIEVLIAPPFTALHPVGKAIQGTTLGLAAQDVYWEEQGAYTGEVSPLQLKDVGCRAVLVGHSERRHAFSESDEMVARKTQAALRHNLVPIVCMGETQEQRRANETAEVLERQLDEGLRGMGQEHAGTLVIAYEPVWAIGTGQGATVKQVAESHRLIRKRISAIFEPKGKRVPILYGGSVTPENIKDLATIDELDGVLVGGASLDPDKFLAIVKTLAVCIGGR